MGALRERGTSNTITALLISALMRGIQIYPLTVVRMRGMLMIKPSLRSPGVRFGVLVIL